MDTIRVQITPDGVCSSNDLLSAIDGPPARGIVGERQSTSVTNGNLRAELNTDGALIFTRIEDGQVLLHESSRVVPSSVLFNFSSSATELYGMGQNRHGKSLFDLYDNRGLNVIGGSYDFGDSIGIEGGPSNSLPWVIAAEPETGFQFGFLWNSPAMGGAAFEKETMRWSLVSDSGNQPLRQQFDFLVTTYATGTAKVDRPFGIMENYVDAVGHAREMPEWGAGYWHSKDRYASQGDLLQVARSFKNRSVPVDVIVIDWNHWDHMGDWSFNEEAWPDPKAMVDELDEMGTKVMVSVWPYSCPGSRSYDELVKNNWFTTTFDQYGNRTTDIIQTHGKNCGLVDPTNADFRKYAWSLIEDGYYKYGIKVFWLDASEPEQMPWQNAAWDAGSMRDIGSLFSWYWAKAIHDGLQANGEDEIMMLPRAGWVGTWRWGAVLWSGDVDEKMSTMADSIAIGLSAQASGIAWWTTDIGGYLGGKPNDPTYRETIVRWFQFGFTCPIFRQHGQRSETAIWAYGSKDEAILGDLIKLRASLKNYFLQQLAKLTATGRPFNRPMHWDFPDDPKTWELAEEGIGGMDPSTPHQLSSGTYVTLEDCDGSSWMQEWDLADDGSVRPAANEANGACLDNGGSPGGQPPSGPYRVHLWGCSSQFSAAQTWSRGGVCTDVQKESDTDRYGGDYTASPAADVDECAQRCCDDSTCRAYAFSANGDPRQSYSSCESGGLCCWLKSNVNGVAPLQGSTSGTVSRGNSSSVVGTGSSGCLAPASSGDKHPIMVACNASDARQQWQQGSDGTLRNKGTGQCLSVSLGRGKVDQYMMGDGYMAAPILQNGQVSRAVYFPLGADWQHHYTGQIYEGGTTATVKAPLEHFPLFKRIPAEAVRVQV